MQKCLHDQIGKKVQVYVDNFILIWLGEKVMPLYQLMKKTDTFVWTPQAGAAFKDLKNMLATMPILASPLSKEPKLLYIAARRARWWPVEGGSAPTTSSNTSDPDRRRPSGCQIDDDDNTPPPYGNHNIVDL
jgi:hypothetical protein